nr:pre-mRNA-processing factor 39 isoform X1 [Tanacetum cinerariifolium]
MITGSADAAIDLLISGIQQVPHSKLLLEELINFAMIHEGSRHLDVLDSIVATAITCKSDGSQNLSLRDREDLSHLYLKFVDYCGTTHEITKAWARHIKHFPRLVRCISSHKYLSNDIVETRDRMPHTVAKQPSQAHVKHTAQNPANEKHNLLTSKSQAIELHKSTANHYVEKDDNNSVKSKRSKRFRSSHSALLAVLSVFRLA